MTQYIIFNAENLRPVDVTIPNDDADSLYSYCMNKCEELESAGRHVAELMFDDYVEDAMVALPNTAVQTLVPVNWIVRYKSVNEQRADYVPRHRGASALDTIKTFIAETVDPTRVGRNPFTS